LLYLKIKIQLTQLNWSLNTDFRTSISHYMHVKVLPLKTVSRLRFIFILKKTSLSSLSDPFHSKTNNIHHWSQVLVKKRFSFSRKFSNVLRSFVMISSWKILKNSFLRSLEANRKNFSCSLVAFANSKINLKLIEN
jgi:hypothetical protein